MKIIAEMTGGFGNQLFAYAAAYAVAKENQADLYIDTYMSDNGMTRELGIDRLDIEFKKRITYKYKRDVFSRAVTNKIRRRIAIGPGTRIVKEKTFYVYHPEIMHPKGDTLLSGFWQTAKYFDKYKDDLRRMFRPKNGFSKDAQELIDMVSGPNTVAVHIRRGDYLLDAANLTMDYFQKAFAVIGESVPDPVYCFVSDDIEWVKKNFGEKENYVFLSGMKPIDDIEEFFVMSACAHQIISNSTFSWWAAYLNPNPDKIVTAPLVSIWKGDFYPEEWIKIDSEIMKGQRGTDR
jgi:hypothetical protein